MKKDNLEQKAADKQKDKPEDQKNIRPAQSAEKAPKPTVAEEEEEENPFGGISARNLKKNLGCGG